MKLRYLPPPVAAFLFFSLAALSPAPQAHAADTPAYLALGDSLAFGVGASNPAAEGYVALTGQSLLLNDRWSERGLEVVNLSEPGATSTDLVEADGQLEHAVTEITERLDNEDANDQVEIISVDIGGNDLLALAEPDSPCFDDPAGSPCRVRINATLSDLQQNLTHILTRLRQAAPQAEIYVIDLYNPYSGTGESLEVIADIGVQMINGVLAAVASDEALGVRFVSVYELFEGRGEEWVAPDGIHPNNDGHRVISEALTAAIEGRDIILPSDIAQPPSVTPSNSDNDGDDGVSTTMLFILLPVAFVAGSVVSAAYFLTRGRA
jgi:lysophospholipase L1-like esterase